MTRVRHFVQSVGNAVAGNIEQNMKVGILAVQGDFEAHAAMLERMGVEHVFVRTRGDLQGLDAVILPGGESTTQWKLLAEEGLDAGLREHAARGGAIFATCAGAILLAKEVRNPPQKSLGLADISVIRNAYGRQVFSDIRHEATKLAPAPLEMVFIRAPIIDRTGPEVEILASSQGKPVLARQGRLLVATFHPELTADTTVHEYFLRLAAPSSGSSSKPASGSTGQPPVSLETR
jgi:5'-phosphate synthase pdxT subunit